MKFDQFDVEHYDKLGELLKKWAEDPTSRPKAGLIKVLEDAMNDPSAGVGVSFKGRKYTTFKFEETPTKHDGDVLVLVMPHDKVIKDAEKDLETNGYQLPDFYEDTFGEPPTIPKAKRKAFHTQRIAEYVMKFCG